MGEVWKAWDPGLNRWTALKFIKQESEATLARFRRESILAARLDHPNIARLYEFAIHDGRPFIAMQYIDGVTLRRSPPGGVREIVRLIRDAARALDHAHSLGIVHRDVKPENLMVSAGAVYVMDFGLARSIETASSISASGFAIGTPLYMSPEQAQGTRQIDGRADVWSLGATLYHLVCGRPPFEGEAMLDVLLAIIGEEPIPPRSIRSELDAGLEAVLLKCLQKRPEDRYASGATLADDLDRWLSGATLSVAGPRFVVKRPRTLIAVLVALVIVGGLGAAIWRTTAGAATARESLLRELRRTAASCLDAALQKRRTGDLPGMAVFAQRTEAICLRVQREAPGLAEPHVLLGRIYRAQMRLDEALREQETALALSPGDPVARLEHGLVCVRKYDALMEAADDAWAASMAIRAGGRPGIAGRVPPRHQLENREAATWRERALHDLRGLEDPIAAALVAWLEDQPSAALFEKAAVESPETEEAFEWRARLARGHRRFDDAIRWYTEGIDRDQGYLPYRTGRAQAHGDRARRSAAAGADASADFALAIADCDAALRLQADDVDLLRRRARLLVNAAISAASRGADASGLYDRALADFDAALARRPESPELLRSRASMLGSRARTDQLRGLEAVETYDRAIADATRAIDADRAHYEGWYTRGVTRLNYAGCLHDLGRPSTEIWTACLADLDETLRLRADVAEIWYVRGYARGRAEEHRADGVEAHVTLGIADFTEALRLDPTFDDALLQRGDALSTLAARRGGAFDEAERDFQEALRLAPGRDEAWHRAGWFHLQCAGLLSRRGEDPSRHRQAAFDCYEKAVQLNPGRDENWVGRGRARAALKQDDALVLADLAKATTINPGRSEGWYYLGVHVSAMGARLQNEGSDPGAVYQRALDAFERAVKAQPGNSHGWSARAELHWNWGVFLAARRLDPTRHWLDAISALDRAIGLGSPRRDLHELRGRVRGDLAFFRRETGRECADDWGRAADDFAVTLKASPERLDLVQRRATCRYQQGLDLKRRRLDPTTAFEEAIVDWTALVKATPSHETHRGRASARGNLGSVRMSRGMEARDLLAGAIEDYTEAIRLNPEAAETWRDRGSTRCILAQSLATTREDPRGHIDDGIRDLDKAIELDARDALAFDMRGTALVMRGIINAAPDDLRRAISDLEKAVELKPALKASVGPKIADARKRLGE